MFSSSSSALLITPVRVIASAGLVCGVLDIACTLTLSRLKGITPKRFLQGIASALLGPKAFAGGVRTAIMGLMIHFFIAFVVAAIYYAASREASALIDHAVLWGHTLWQPRAPVPDLRGVATVGSSAPVFRRGFCDAVDCSHALCRATYRSSSGILHES